MRVAELMREDTGDEVALGVARVHVPAVQQRRRFGDVTGVVGPLWERDAEHGVARNPEIFLEDRAVGVVEHPEAVAVLLLVELRCIGASHVSNAGLALDRALDPGLEGGGRHVVPLVERELRDLVGALDRDERRDAVEVISERPAPVGPDGDRALAGVPDIGARRARSLQVQRGPAACAVPQASARPTAALKMLDFISASPRSRSSCRSRRGRRGRRTSRRRRHPCWTASRAPSRSAVRPGSSRRRTVRGC